MPLASETLAAVLAGQFFQAARVGAAAAHPFGLPVPAEAAGVPAAAEGLESIFLGLGVATDPDPEADQINLQIIELHQLSDLVHDLLLSLVVVCVFVAVELLAALAFQAGVVLAVDGLHGFKAAAEIRVELAGELAVTSFDFGDGLEFGEEVAGHGWFVGGGGPPLR